MKAVGCFYLKFLGGDKRLSPNPKVEVIFILKQTPIKHVNSIRSFQHTNDKTMKTVSIEILNSPFIEYTFYI